MFRGGMKRSLHLSSLDPPPGSRPSPPSSPKPPKSTTSHVSDSSSASPASLFSPPCSRPFESVPPEIIQSINTRLLRLAVASSDLSSSTANLPPHLVNGPLPSSVAPSSNISLSVGVFYAAASPAAASHPFSHSFLEIPVYSAPSLAQKSFMLR